MDFFTAQDNARRKTGRLVVLMVLAVLALIAVTTLAITIALHLMGEQSASQTNLSAQGMWSALSIELVIGVAIAVLAVVVLGGLFKRSQLSRSPWWARDQS